MNQEEKSIPKTIRFRKEVYDAIRNRAKKENRTFNNMVETILIEIMEKQK